MTDKKVWLITGASRGMGVEFAKAALAAALLAQANADREIAMTTALDAA